MPGDTYLSDYDYGAGAGYGWSGSEQTLVTGGGHHGGHSHTSFVIWLVIISSAAMFALHGFKVAGFVFTFKR